MWAKPPEQQLDPVLSEEGLPVEDHRRHAPMAGLLEGIMVGFEG
jgi:hypothetical protein